MTQLALVSIQLGSGSLARQSPELEDKEAWENTCRTLGSNAYFGMGLR